MTDDIEQLGISVDELCALIYQLMPAWDGDALGSFGYLSGGYSNANVVFSRGVEGKKRRYVLRIPQRPQPYVDRRAEVEWYRRMPAHVGVQPLALDVTMGTMLSPWCSGELLVEVYHQRFGEADLLNYLQQLHERLPVEPRQYHVPFLLEDFVGHTDHQRLKNDGPAQAFMADPDMQVARTCHNDLNPWNILVNDEGWTTLDWEFVGQNDPLFDLVGLHQGLELSLDSLPQMAEVFAPDCSADRLLRAFAHFWLREGAWAKFQLSSGNTRREIVDQAAIADAHLSNLPRF